jgi:hypothetical protein
MRSVGDDHKFEFELKLVLPNDRVAPAAAFLKAICAQDAQHPANIVASIYFDTRRLDFVHEKLNSDLLKTKVRLRWYENLRTREPLGATFAEIKYRRGLCRRKHRLETPCRAKDVARMDLRDRSLLKIPGLLESGAVFDLSRLEPLLEVRYQRLRFIEPMTGSRVSLDTKIGLGRVHKGRLAYTNRRRLEQAVIEIKNRSGRIPALLNPLMRMGAKRDSFSKYFACFDLATSGVGARL